MLAVTLVCILCGLAVSKNEKTLAYFLTVASLTPAAIVALTLVSFSRRRKTVLVVTFIGVVAGFVCAGLSVGGGGAFNSPWEAVGSVFVPIAINSTIGALLFGGITLAGDLLDSRFPPDPRS